MEGVLNPVVDARAKRRGASALSVVAFTDDPALGDSLGRLADGESIPWVEVAPGGLAGALGETQVTADVALIDVSELAEREAVEGIRALATRTRSALIAVGRDNDVGLYRALIAAGARDYLVSPLDERVLADALNPTAEPPPSARPGPAEARAARVNLMIGARGGVGASALAVDAAWWAAEKLGVETGLIDLDVHFGSCALALDLMPGRGLRDALESPERIDSLFVGSAMMNVGDKLFVLAAEEDPEQPVFPSPDAPARLIEALGESFPCLIVDLPRTLAGLYPEVLARADSVTLVSDLTLAGLRDALRLKQLCEKRCEGASLAIALHEAPAGKPAVTVKEFEKGYGDAVDWMIPHQPKPAAEAAAAGKPIVSLMRAGHPAAKAVASIAERCVDPAGLPTKKKRAWLW
ncbi:MAG: hypothetical protein RIB45_15535 [Marivibrio sp.]|uniref:AAA family ATPase n=1 Tax=Marivibrio sp. TaxID=2039719 RepID=UPI0032EFA393